VLFDINGNSNRPEIKGIDEPVKRVYSFVDNP
jgi:hypothetical protein